jgi:DENN (AEX-3) domain
MLLGISKPLYLLSHDTIDDYGRPYRNDGKSRSNVSSFYLEAQYILSNIMDCLAWEYTNTIYPSFEISKDYSTLRSSMVADISSCITTDSDIQSTHRSKDGSLNELLRTKRIPSSLTIHRRVRTESNEAVLPTHRNPSTIKILLFDSCADVAHSDNQQSLPKLIGVGATEEVCMRAQVQVRGKIEVVGYRTVLSEEQQEIGRQEKSNESLRALSTFFVPTGKPVILEKSSSNKTADDKQGSSAKLYSMVLNARDQTPLYACSLVFYRSFRLQNVAENQSSITPNFNDTRDVFKNSGHPVDQRSKQNIGNESNVKGTRISFTTPIVADSEGNQANIKNPFLEDAESESVLSTPLYNLADLSLCIVDSTLNLDALTIAVTSPNTACRESLPCAFRVQPVSEMTAATPLHEHTSLKESSANFLETSRSGIKVPLELFGLASGTFSDDESAGIKSSIKSSSDELVSPQRIPEQADTRIPSENAKPLQGTFAEFLSATANVTASVASALAFQAGSLPTSSFAWSANNHSNSNANELKGFYDNLSFSRFKAKHFSTISNGDYKYSEVGSKLKRKYDDNVIHSPVASKVTNLLSSHSSLTTPTVQSETCSNSPLVLQSTFESDNPSQPWVFSPQKYSLSSYPKFGTGKPTKKNGASPRTPRSPCRKCLPQNNSRKSRSAVTLASRQGVILSSTEIIPKPNNSNKFDFLISNGSSATIDDPKFSPKVGKGIIQAIQGRTANGEKNSERSVGHLIAERPQFLIDEKHTMAHASYGFALISEVPVMEYLRKVAYLVAPEFEKKYDKMMNSDGTSPPSSGHLEELSQIIKESFSNASSLSGVNILDKCKLLSTSDIPSTSYKETFSNRESSTDRNINEPDDDDEADYNSIIVFDALSPKNVVTVLIAFLLEYRIVAVSSRALSASTHLGEWLKDAINPLKYAHVYSPLVPPCIGLQLIHCPAPFFIGMRRSPRIDEIVELEDERDREKNEGRRGKPTLPRDSNCGLLLVDLDRDECSMPQDLCSLVRSAKVLIRALESLLYPHLYNCDEIDAGIQRELKKPEKLAHDATKLCKRFVRSLLEGSKQSCLSAKDGDEIVVLFDETLFVHQHSIQLSLNPAIIDMDFEAEKRQLDMDFKKAEQNTRDTNANNVEYSRYHESMLPSTTTGNKDIQNLLRYLMRTQSFSYYLTS